MEDSPHAASRASSAGNLTCRRLATSPKNGYDYKGYCRVGTRKRKLQEMCAVKVPRKGQGSRFVVDTTKKVAKPGTCLLQSLPAASNWRIHSRMGIYLLHLGCAHFPGQWVVPRQRRKAIHDGIGKPPQRQRHHKDNTTKTSDPPFASRMWCQIAQYMMAWLLPLCHPRPARGQDLGLALSRGLVEV